MGQSIEVNSTPQVFQLLEQKETHGLNDSPILKYQVLLLENSDIKLKVCLALNPANFLLIPKDASSSHLSVEIIELTCSSRSDLPDFLIPNPEVNWYMDRIRKAEYAIVFLTQTIEARALLTGTSAQLAEL